MLRAYTCDTWRCVPHITVIAKVYGGGEKVTSGHQGLGLHSCYAFSSRISRGGIVCHPNIVLELELFD